MTTISRRKALTLIAAAGGAALIPSISFAEGKTLICNWDRSFPPYSMERDGKMTGILIDCMDELLGKRMGYTVEHRGYAWPDAQSLVREGKADCLCTNPTEERLKFMTFSDDAVVESLPSIFCDATNPRLAQINNITTVDDLRDFRQVDYKGNGWAKQMFPSDLQIQYVENLSDVFDTITKGEADIFVGNGLAAMYVVKQRGLKKRIHAREFPIGEPSSFHLGLRNDHPDLKGFFDDFEKALDEAMAVDATRNIILQYL